MHLKIIMKQYKLSSGQVILLSSKIANNMGIIDDVRDNNDVNKSNTNQTLNQTSTQPSTTESSSTSNCSQVCGSTTESSTSNCPQPISDNFQIKLEELIKTIGNVHSKIPNSTNVATAPVCIRFPNSTNVATAPVCIRFPNSTNVATDAVCIRIPNSTNVATESIEVPSQLKGILGTWKGYIGANLVNIRFEFTSERKNLLAYFTLFTQPSVPFNDYSDMISAAPETLSTKVKYSNLRGTLFIEDCTVVDQATVTHMTAWVINNNIIGKLTDGSQVNLVKAT